MDVPPAQGTVEVRMGRQGRIVVPSELRAQLELEEGTQLLLRIDSGELVLTTPARAIGRAQELIRKSLHPDADTSIKAFIEQRRLDARRENE